MNLFDTWFELGGAIVQVLSLGAILFAAKAVERLRNRIMKNKLNPQLVQNVRKTMESARLNFSTQRILRHDTAIYFERVSESLLQLNRENTKEWLPGIRIWWFRRQLAWYSSSAPRTLQTMQAFDRFVEGWMTRFEHSERARRERDRHVV